MRDTARDKLRGCTGEPQDPDCSQQASPPPLLPTASFVPPTYLINLGTDKLELLQQLQQELRRPDRGRASGKVWIVKPVAANQGHGIFMTRDASLLLHDYLGTCSAVSHVMCCACSHVADGAPSTRCSLSPTCCPRDAQDIYFGRAASRAPVLPTCRQRWLLPTRSYRHNAGWRAREPAPHDAAARGLGGCEHEKEGKDVHVLATPVKRFRERCEQGMLDLSPGGTIHAGWDGTGAMSSLPVPPLLHTFSACRQLPVVERQTGGFMPRSTTAFGV